MLPMLAMPVPYEVFIGRCQPSWTVFFGDRWSVRSGSSRKLPPMMPFSITVMY